MCERLGGTKQVAHTIEVVLVLLDGFNTHPLPRQQSLVARGIAWWGHELKVSMTATKEESSPEVTEADSVQDFIYLTKRSLYTALILCGNSALIFIRLIIKKRLI